MSPELRLYEDVLTNDGEVSLPAQPRMIFVVHGSLVTADHSVRDGETIVLGGLFEDVDSATITKFPVLGDLPVLGAFFRNRQTSHNKDEVVFFITPHVLGGDSKSN